VGLLRRLRRAGGGWKEDGTQVDDLSVVKSVLPRGGRCVLFGQPGSQGRCTDCRSPGNVYSEFERYEKWGDIRSFWCSGCDSSSFVDSESTLEST
jgi:hypothetical protein